MRALFALLALACALCGAGCGAGGEEGETTLVVTRDFGASVVKPSASVELTPGLTAMRQLQKLHTASTSYGGRYVDAIGDLKESGSDSWLYYVNGIEADRGATGERLESGDRVQWDFHAWQAVRTGGAIVGAYPEPLLTRGAELVCVPQKSAACTAVRDALKVARVPTGGEGAARVVVGPWRTVAGAEGVPDLTSPAATNGAFAEFSSDGSKLTPVADDGSSQAALTAGAGLLTASNRGSAPVWLITGTDTAGTLAAARLLEHPEQLVNRFTMLVAAGRARALPESGSR